MSFRGNNLKCKVWPPRFKESSVRVHHICVPPRKRAISAIVNKSSTRNVADRHRLAAYHDKHCWRAFWWYQHWWPWTTLNPKNLGLKWFFCYFRLLNTHTYLSGFSLKYTGDRPRQPAYETKLLLSRVSWALAQISCLFCCVTLLTWGRGLGIGYQYYC